MQSVISSDQRQAFLNDGYLTLAGAIEQSWLRHFQADADQLLTHSANRGGARGALSQSPQLRSLGETGACAAIAQALLGPSTRLVRLTIFDKTPEANWKVPWHQDLTIAVRQRHDVPNFGPWTEKAGVPHVQPPLDILQHMLAIRAHLDDTPAHNGALRVLPGSHRHGRLSTHQLQTLKAQTAEHCCEMPAGGLLAMSPLLAHASSAATNPSRRRVLHYEYAAIDLPDPLDWPTW
jgi:hypothetical protein